MTQNWSMLMQNKEKVIEITYKNSTLVTEMKYSEETWKFISKCFKKKKFIEYNDYIIRSSEILSIMIIEKKQDEEEK